MIAERDLVVLESAGSQLWSARRGSEIEAGQGPMVRSGDRTLRSKCPARLARYQSDPDQFFAGSAGALLLR